MKNIFWELTFWQQMRWLVSPGYREQCEIFYDIYDMLQKMKGDHRPVHRWSVTVNKQSVEMKPNFRIVRNSDVQWENW